MKRRAYLILFIILSGIITLTAHPIAAATTTPIQGVQFHGSGNITINSQLTVSGFTIVLLFKIDNVTSPMLWDGAPGSLAISNSRLNFVVPTLVTSTVFGGTTVTTAIYNSISVPITPGTYLFIGMYNGTAMKAYLNGYLIGEKGVSGQGHPTITSQILAGNLDGSIYEFMLFNGTINTTTINEIFENPLNPPKPSNLLIQYLPSTLNATASQWDDTVAGRNATINGGTIFNVSLTPFVAYDSLTKQKIPLNTINVSIVSGSTENPLLPAFFILPANKTITLNITAPGYYPKLMTITTPVDSLIVYLSSSTTQVVLNEQDFKALEYWPGGGIGAKILHLNLKGALIRFFSNPYIPLLGVIVALMIWGFGVFLAWTYSKEPEFVAIWGIVLYDGLQEFVALNQYFDLFQRVFIPFAFVIAMMYLKKVFDVFGGA